MVDFVYPTNAELSAIAQDKLPRLTANRPIFSFFPMRSTPDALVMWEQMDNFVGLQQARGINGQPTRIKKTGGKRYIVQPGYYGEYEYIDEAEMTLRRNWGTFNDVIDVSDLVMIAQDKLLGRRLDRIELILWTLVSTGTFSVSGPTGGVMHTDSFTVQTFSAVVAWATVATATPLADFRSVQTLHRGHSVSFGADATAYMNQTTFNNLLSNINTADLYGRRQAGLGLINNLQDVNRLFAGDNLPQIAIYDEGYLDEANAFQLYIPNAKVVVVGRRPAGQVVGEYLMTRNINADGAASGPYMKVIDKGALQVPRSLEVHDGHNGGPALYFGSAIVVMSV